MSKCIYCHDNTENVAPVCDTCRAKRIYESILQLLEKRSDVPGVFSVNGDEILSKDEAALDALANLFDQLGLESHTGYYDPEEDERSGEVDKLTGYYYLEAE